MAKRRSSKKKTPARAAEYEPLDYATPAVASKATSDILHKISDNVLCKTGKRGFATPDNRSLTELVVDASEGFIPLWAEGVTLKWRFQEQSMQIFRSPEMAKNYFHELFGKALMLWGDASPVKFVQRDDVWDFEIAMQAQDDCDGNGCVLASAFFPDAGRHELKIFPKLLEQPEDEQIETMAHEVGHIFGLRHFFAQIQEARWRSEIFGTHSPFSIMNYGTDSRMTENDRSDLKRLYELARSGQLTEINGTPIQLVLPYSGASGRVCQMSQALAAQIEPSTTRSCKCCGNVLS